MPFMLSVEPANAGNNPFVLTVASANVDNNPFALSVGRKAEVEVSASSILIPVCE
jgi:hypothetical protein